MGARRGIRDAEGRDHRGARDAQVPSEVEHGHGKPFLAHEAVRLIAADAEGASCGRYVHCRRPRQDLVHRRTRFDIVASKVRQASQLGPTCKAVPVAVAAWMAS